MTNSDSACEPDETSIKLPRDHNHTDAPLRIGVMLDSLTVNAWEYKVLADIQNSTFANLELIVLNDSQPAPRPSSFVARTRARLPNLLYSSYLKLDYKLTRERVKHDAFAKHDARPLLDGITQLLVRPIQKKFTDRFQPDDIEKIKSTNIDVMIRFGFRIIRGEILNVARYGVWSMHHGDNDHYRGGPAHFWEIYEGNPLTGVVLQILSDDLDAGLVIYRSWGRTNPHSLFLNRNPVYWKSAEFYLRRLRLLHDRGFDYIRQMAHEQKPQPYEKAIYRNPSNWAMVKYLGRIAKRWAGGRLHRLLHREAWFIAWRERTADEEIFPNHNGLQMLEANAERYFADPFLITHDGANWVYFEDYPYATGKGVISCMKINHDGSAGPVQTVLERPYHLSFPYLLRDDNGLTMIPETRGNHCIEAFSCVDFPAKWEPASVVMSDVSAADSVLFQHDGLWWLFTNCRVQGAAGDDELFLYHAETKNGPWNSHPLNPIISDVRCARMAGGIFEINGKLVRPAQDGTKSYGGGVVFHQIETLSTEDYRETCFHRITDAGITGNIGTHTYGRNEKYEIIDGRFVRSRFSFK